MRVLIDDTYAQHAPRSGTAVYVSQRTVELLTEAELEAVLAHEHHHRRVRDPLRVAGGRILSEALFFVPVLRKLCERYAELAVRVGAPMS